MSQNLRLAAGDFRGGEPLADGTRSEGQLRLSPEEKLLLLTCRPYLSGTDRASITELVCSDLDWDYVVWRAEIFRTAPLLWYHLLKLKLTQYVSELPSQYLQLWARLSAERSRLAYRELLTISGVLNGAGIHHFLIKGAALSPLMYPDPFIRPMLDVDIVVRPEAILECRQRLVDLGYLHAYWDYKTNRVTPLAAEAIAEHQEAHYELPGFLKLCRTRIQIEPKLLTRALRQKHVKCHMSSTGLVSFPIFLDVHFNLSVGLDLADVWRGVTVERIFGRQIAVQSATGMIWFLASRLYNETFQTNGQKLIMLGDLAALLRERASAVDWNELVEVVRRYGMQPSLFYVLAHLVKLNWADVPSWVISQFRPTPDGKPHGMDWGDFLPKLLGRSILFDVGP